MQKPVLIVSGRAADRLARLPARAGLSESAFAASSYQSLLDASRSTIFASVLSHPFDLPGSAEPEASGAHGAAMNSSSIGADRDPGAQVVVTPETLVQLRIIHGSWVEVSNPARPDIQPRTAIVLAADSLASGAAGALPNAHNGQGRNGNEQSSTSALTRKHNGNGAVKRSPSCRKLENHRAPIKNGVQREQGEPQLLQRGVAYLAPLLAYNLGVEFRLAPFLIGQFPEKGKAGDEDRNGMLGGIIPPPFGNVKIKLLASAVLGSKNGMPLRSVKQPGKLHTEIPVAKSLVLAKVRCPEAAPVPQVDRKRASKAAEPEGGEAGPSGEGAAEAAKQVRTVDGGTEAAVDDLVAALQDYFSKRTRLLAKGDVIAVGMTDSSGRSSLLQTLYGTAGTKGLGHLTSRVAFLKVVDVQPECTASCIVDPTETSVSLQGTCAASIPVGLSAHVSATTTSGSGPALERGNKGRNRASEPSGGKGVLGQDVAAAWMEAAELAGTGPLLPAWRQLAHIIAPLLHGSSSPAGVHAAVLLTGPEGSGRTTAARAAAAALGLHVVPFSGQELRSGSRTEGRAGAALRAAFRTAADYAPSVFLLTQLEALAEGSGVEGPGARGSMATRLATVLSDCIASGCAATDTHSAADSRVRPLPPTSVSGGGDGANFRDTPPSTPDDTSATPQHDPVGGPGQQASHGHWGPVVLVACASAAENVPGPIRRCFTHELAVEAPDTDRRLGLLQGLLANAAGPDLTDVELQDAAAQTAGMLPHDLAAIAADAAAAAALDAVEPHSVLFRDEGQGQEPGAAGGEMCRGVSGKHLASALDLVRQRTATAIGAPQVPDVKWADVGGLEDVKSAILETVELPLQHPHLFAAGLRRRSGVLLYGPPGTGKTLVAKAVATECSLNFLSVKGPELINMYIGESERQVREVFARARRARPCVLFFDELDSLAPARGAAGDSGGVMDRIVAQLLAEVDGVQSQPGGAASAGSQDVFVIGATNRPDLLDPALLRPGRLDKLLYVGVAEDVESKVKVLQALTRKFKLSEQVDLVKVASECAITFTGADLYALCADAWMNALKRTAAEAQGTEEEGEVLVEPVDFWDALRELRPSLSSDELARYQTLRRQYEGRS